MWVVEKKKKKEEEEENGKMRYFGSCEKNKKINKNNKNILK